ncbi:MAG: DNA-3-methyladenine glycosylase I [Treponema sp.]|jgi:DNA-3-methyladenine glycosylase I|nr:DNA-3-methyladenine glycosylase I [Treponema sp.]
MNPTEKGEKSRCPWCVGDALYTAYHDEEWGTPQFDDRALFEALILDGAQAGLSWITILRRREGYRAAFDGMNPEKIARYTEADITRLMGDARIIRNRRKISSTIANARAYLGIREGATSFSAYLWDFVGGEPVVNHYAALAEVPASTELSAKLSDDLKRRGFSFVGPTIVYAYMQAMGMVNDHLVSCFRHPDCASG